MNTNDRTQRSALRSCLLSALVCLSLGFTSASRAVGPAAKPFTYAAGATCFEFNCGNLVEVSAIVPGADQFDAACRQAWAKVYVFPGDFFHSSSPDGHCYYANVNSPNTKAPWAGWVTLEIPDPKNNGRPCPACGNPINPGTGNKFLQETDFATVGLGAMRFERTYNSTALDATRIGQKWRMSYDRSVSSVLLNSQPNPQIPVVVNRPDGRATYFTYANGQFSTSPDANDRLSVSFDASGAVTGYTFVTAPDDETETYDAQGRLLSITARSGLTHTLQYSSGGRLLSVTDPFGKQILFAYDGNARISGVTAPDGGVFRYAYDATGNLQTVTYPGGAQRIYHYNEPENVFPTPGPLTWTKATVTDCHSASCNPVFTDTAYVAGSNALAACQLAASQTFWFGSAGFGGARGGPDNGDCFYNDPAGPSQPAFGSWQTVTGCVTGTYPNQVIASGSPGCPVSLPNALTGITDENGNRFATYQYNSDGLAVSSSHAGGAESVTLTYTSTTAVATDALGAQRTYVFDTPQNLARNTSLAQLNASGSGTAASTLAYDANANLSARTDLNGNLTSYVYDLARNLETSRTEGLTATGNTTAQTRTISTAWDANFHLPTAVVEPLRITSSVYDATGAQCGARGAQCTRTIQATTDATGASAFNAIPVGAPRTWTYTYNANGAVLTAKGPRLDAADITAYTYYPNNASCPVGNGGHPAGCRGQVQTITNAFGHVTQITAYNGQGRALATIDPNGLETVLSYDPMQRLTSKNVEGEVTSYAYDAAGQLTKVTLPDGSFLSYSYDAAHRVTSMSDGLGNRVAYTLDAMGNRTQEQMFDPTGALAQTRSRVFNSLNRLFQEIGATGQTTQYAYDNQGNVTSIDGPLAGTVDVTVNAYDALNRLRQVTDRNNGVTQYVYDGIDQLVSVTDPRNLATSYNFDGLANLNSQVSPDTGTTTSTYDAAGNLLTQTDAKGQRTTRQYDALNRVTVAAFTDGSVQAYGYDAGTNGIGRLTSITELNASLQITNAATYAYDQHGRMASETRTLNGVTYTLAYSYDSFGRLSGMTYPSGRTVAYAFDALGRIGQLSTTPPPSTGGAQQIVASNIAYQPFGGVKSFTLINGQTYTRGYDLDGRVASYTLGSQIFAIGYDAASRIGFVSDAANAANTNTYSYDNLDRLTGAVLPGTPFAYAYDAVGNRTSKTAGSSTDTYAYSATSNQVASITAQAGAVRNFAFDANGSTTADGVNLYGYDARGRMVQSTGALGATTYQLNALGQRIRKTNASDDRVFLYDTWGHLIAETDPGGGLKREYIYLNDIPLAVIQ